MFSYAFCLPTQPMGPRVTAVRQQQAGAARAVGPAAAVVLSQQAQEAAEVVPGVTESPGRRSGRNHSASSASRSPKKKRDLPSEETKSPEKKNAAICLRKKQMLVTTDS